MCDEYDYVAIGGLVFHIRKCEYELIRKLVNYAFKKGVKVHGLGFTKTSELTKYKFYSVDSASWVRGAALGQQRYDFINGKMKYRTISGTGKKTNIPLLVGHNCIEWCKYQRYMERK